MITSGKQLKEISDWYKHYPGKYLLDAEQNELNKLLPHFFGYHLVQVGGSHQIDYSTSSINHHVFAVPLKASAFMGTVVMTHFDELPFIHESVDIVVMPHVLECVSDPKKIINEIYHILIPGGTLVIFGFNPMSLWGLYKLVSPKDKFPWSGKFYTASRVNYWLKAVGFSVHIQKSLCFRPPMKQLETFNRWLFLEAVGQLGWPFWGGIYMLVVKKEALPMTPIKAKYFDKKIPVTSGYPEPSGYK